MTILHSETYWVISEKAVNGFENGGNENIRRGTSSRIIGKREEHSYVGPRGLPLRNTQLLSVNKDT
jgi:hypothetical protein